MPGRLSARRRRLPHRRARPPDADEFGRRFRQAWFDGDPQGGAPSAAAEVPVVPAPAQARPDDDDATNTGNDPTRPVTRFEVRSRYASLAGGEYRYETIFRLEKTYALEDGAKIGLRLSLPVRTTDASAGNDNLSNTGATGMGDLLTQATYILPQMGRYRVGGGIRFVWPTETEAEMGDGKFVVAPVVGAAADLPKISRGSFVGLVLKEFDSYAGIGARTRVDQLSVRPYFQVALPGGWYALTNPDIRINWQQHGQIFLPLNLEIGRKFADRFVASFAGDYGLVRDYDRYDWRLTLRGGFDF